MNGWQKDKRWSDKFLTEIKSILGVYLIGEPPVEEDRDRNTDLMVLKMEAVRIGCRIRRHSFIRYENEFTIRNARPGGIKTELAKIIEGWGNYLFYGFSDVDEKELSAWALVDLNVFRLWHGRQLVIRKGEMPGKLMRNKDGSSDFRVYSLTNLPAHFVIARKHRAASQSSAF